MRVKTKCYLGGLFVAAAALSLRLYDLGEESLWIDEAITYGRATLPLDRLIADTLRRKHVPTYFVLMHFFVTIGDSEFWLRLPSALLGTMTAVLLYAAGYVLRGLWAGIAAGLLVALSPVHLGYSQEARMYALGTCACALATLCSAALFAAITRRHSARLTSLRAWPWWGLSVASLLSLYNHNTGLFCVAGLQCVGLCLWWRCREARPRILRNWLLCQGVALLLWLPWLPHLRAQAGTFDKWHNPPMSFEHAAMTLERLFSLSGDDGGLGLIVAALAALPLLRKPQRDSAWVALLGFSLLGFLATTLASLLKANMFFVRTLLWTSLPLFLLIGCGLSRWRSRFARLALLLALVAFFVPLLNAYYTTERKPPWRPFLAQLAAQRKPDEPVLLLRGARFTRYYFGRKTDPLPAQPVLEYRPKASLAANLGGHPKRFWVVVQMRSNRARGFLRVLQRSPYRPVFRLARKGAYIARYERR